MAAPTETTPLLASAAALPVDDQIDAGPDRTIGASADPESAPAVSPSEMTLPSPSAVTFIIGSLFMVVFLSALDATIVATTYAKIGSEFNQSNKVAWIATSYMILSTSFQPLYGRLSDIFGRKAALLTGLLTFLLGSVFCAISPTLPFLIFSRAFAGLGGGGTLTTSSIIMSDLVPLRERGRLQGLANAVFGSASMIGAPLGGWLADQWGWRWAFWINIPVGVPAVVFIVFFLTNYNVIGREVTSIWGKLAMVDYAGIVTLATGVTGIVTALSLGGNELPWDNIWVIGLLVAGLVFLSLFVLVEARHAKQPIMPLRILAEQTPCSAYLMNFFDSMSSISSVFLIPLWFQVVLGQTAAQSGLYLIPKIVGSSIGSITSGIYMQRTGRYLGFLYASLLLTVVFETYTLLGWQVDSPTWVYVLTVTLDGFGFGAILTITLIAMLASLPQSDMAVSSAMSYLFRSTGAVLGVAISQATLQSVLFVQLRQRIQGPDAERIIEVARKSIADIRNTIEDPEVVQQVVDSFIVAIRAGFAVCLACATLGLICGFWMKRHELKTSR